jgi:hypothetical protein
MRKAPAGLIPLLLSLYWLYAPDRCLGQVNIGQLHIGAGTTWVSTNQTTVVLDNMDLQYDADPVLLNNVFRFTGTRINSIRGDTRPTIYAITIDKTDPGKVTDNQAFSITKRINFAAGDLDLNGSAIFLQPFAILTNESEYGKIVGPTGGYITIDADLSSPEGANPGNLGAILTSFDNLGKVTISRSHNLQNINDSGQSIARWYNITPPVGTKYTTKLRFTWFASESEGFRNDSLVLWQGPPESKWVDIGYTNRDGSLLFVEKEGLTSLDRFTLYPGISTSSTTPPVTTPPSPPTEGAMLLIGNWNNNVAALNWTVTSEYQNDHFDVERKYTSESSFSTITKILTTAPGGTRSTPGVYTFTDPTVKTTPDDIAYRIHQVATNGQNAYSNIVTLKAKTDSTDEFIRKLFPTIAIGGRVYIQVGNAPVTKMAFMIVDSKGSIVLTGDLPYQSQWLPVHFLSHGVYRLILRSGFQKFHSTFIR